jgi:hydrogenase/urease accessory protein HupE
MRKQVLNIVLLLIIPLLTSAHEIRPAYLEIKENTDHSLQITWKQPTTGAYSIPLYPTISTGWMIDSLAKVSYTESYLIKRWQVPANHASLDEQVIRIAGLEQTITDVLVQVTLLNNVSFTYLIKPIEPFAILNISKPSVPPIWQYIQLGILHIWSGYDHLLFVLGLLLLVRKRAKLFWTITAFTVAHSITLALATMHILRVSTSFTESAIALSIIFLAVELLRHYKGINGYMYHYPWLGSFLFGLLHGLGFAGALQDVGLPENNIPLALLLFNLGVEAGQLAFVFLILLLMSGIRRLHFRQPTWSYKIPAYLIGTMAMYWFIERVMAGGQ